MPIKFRCEHCRQLLGISQTKAGERVDCPTCGRAVRVPTLDGKPVPAPRSKMNLQDSSLLNALDALAGLGMGASLTPKHSAGASREEDSEQFPRGAVDESKRSMSPREDSSAIEEAQELAPVPLPEPVELPPLEKPVALEEPMVPAGKPVQDTLPAKTRAARSDTPADPLAALATLAGRPAPSTGRETVPAPQYSSLGSLLLVSCLSFLAGFLVHAQFFSNSSGSSQSVPKNAETERVPPVAPAQSTALTEESSRRRAVEGRVTFRTSEGNSKADAGATVILLPASRSSSAKLPIVGFRPADHQEDRSIARASARALGGDVCVVDEEGRFAAQLDQSGNYHVVVLSHFLQRADEDVRLPESVKTVLLDYFDRPEQLPGRRRYHLGYVYYRGEATEIWDYSFERL